MYINQLTLLISRKERILCKPACYTSRKHNEI